MDVQAVIHFVGLIVFTTQVSSPMNVSPNMRAARLRHPSPISTEQVIAIMPEVRSDRWSQPVVTVRAAMSVPNGRRAFEAEAVALDDASPSPVTTPITTPVTPAGPSPEVVEAHSTLLIFEPWTLTVPAVGWNVQHLNNDFDYIELNHDRVSFIADRPNPAASIPSQLRHIGGTLKADYAPPAHTAAAAVFDLPAGALTACSSDAAGTNGRIDTELRLNTSGTIKIKSAATINSGAKILTLDANATIYVVNVPKAYAVSHDLTHKAINHYLVYCRMVGIADGNCEVAYSHLSCAKCSGNQQTIKNPDARYPAARMANATQARRPSEPPPIVALASFECSNSQYP